MEDNIFGNFTKNQALEIFSIMGEPWVAPMYGLQHPLSKSLLNRLANLDIEESKFVLSLVEEIKQLTTSANSSISESNLKRVEDIEFYQSNITAMQKAERLSVARRLSIFLNITIKEGSYCLDTNGGGSFFGRIDI